MNDLYQSVTDRIVAALEAGTPPWVKPWTANADSGLPVNAGTRRPYRGINVVLLMLEAMSRGYNHNAWLTYRQATALGGQVRAGSTGTTVVFFRRIEVPEAETDLSPRVIPLLRSFTVFNLDQIDNLPAQFTKPAEPPAWNSLDAAEYVLTASGADIRYAGNSAYYHPPTDRIQLPARSSFASADAHYATAFHELAHWSGAASRLDRDLKGRFGDNAYAAEELIAEISSAFVCAHLGIEGKLQHAAYVHSWISVLRSDKRAVFTAAAKAQAAADFLLRDAWGSEAQTRSSESIASV
jgi:antirestriction protein ArdC